MAFTFCTNCGEKIDDSEKVCPHCGHPKGADRSYRYGQEWYGNTDNGNENKNNNDDNNANNNNGSNGSQQQNPYGQYQPPFGNNGGQNNGQQNQNPYGQNPYGQNPYGQGGQYGGGYGNGGYNNGSYSNGNYNGGYNGQYQPPFGQQTPWRQPNQQPQRQMSIALVIFSVINIIFGCCCIGMVFGIVGLIFTLNARNAPTDEEEARRKKIALALNIVGVALTIIYAVVYVVTILVKYLPL